MLISYHMKTIFTTLLVACLVGYGTMQAQEASTRWTLNPDGTTTWNVTDAHSDHIEMSGRQVSTVVRYGVDGQGAFQYTRGMVWPLLRTLPNDTHASLMRRMAWNPLAEITLNTRCAEGEQVKSIHLGSGMMTVNSTIPVYRGEQVALTRTLFPSTEQPAFLERYTLTNTGTKPVRVEIPEAKSVITTDPAKGVRGSYRIETGLIGARTATLEAGQELTFDAYTVGYQPEQAPITFDVAREMQARRALVASLQDNLVFQSPDPVLNSMFDFAKLRACESIYATAQGPMHGPGGESYYAAIWANDQAEYINPFFPFVGYDYGNQSALNSFLHFVRFMNPEWKPIPSSIIAEGLSFWNGAGDRGDAAMIAYGAARYALASGSKEEAEQLWPLIEWCLEFSRRKLTADGVVASDADELENRFPAGDANLCTSSLYYDALLSAAYLAKELGKQPAGSIYVKQGATYTQQADALRKAIDKHFAAKVEGFDTYQYYDGNDVLRSWICIPLTVGLYEQKAGTIDALFSPRLWTKDGLLTQAGSETFWDRSTLYALRGVFACGETEKAADYLKYYSTQRLLGNHVPYAIEAWPEGGQRHLSAESGLYCRIITEGLFGIRPTGLKSFTLTPRLPKDWPEMALKNVRAFGGDFNISVVRAAGDKLTVTVTTAAGRQVLKKSVKEGATLPVAVVTHEPTDEEADAEPLVSETVALPTLLVIDDNEELRTFLYQQLAAHYQILLAESGEEALGILTTHRVHLIVSDVMMPGMDGFELSRRVKQELATSHIPLILLTARAHIDAKIEGLETGADVYIEKPFSVDFLCAQINSLLLNRAKLRQQFVDQPLVRSATIATSRADKELLARMDAVIEKNLAESEFSVEDLAGELCMSRSTLFEKIKSVSGLTPNNYIRLARLKKAAEYLSGGEYMINEVCYLVGFSSSSYFTKCFKKQFGMLPTEFVER